MRFCTPTEKQEKGYRRWVAKLPKGARQVAERFDLWTLYRLKITGQRVTIRAFHDDGSITVNVTGRFNRVAFNRQVFGITADELEECDLPGPDEALGAVITTEEARDNLDVLRVMVRPDLWVMGEDGKAVRKQ